MFLLNKSAEEERDQKKKQHCMHECSSTSYLNSQHHSFTEERKENIQGPVIQTRRTNRNQNRIA